MRHRAIMWVLVLALCTVSVAAAQTVPGNTVEERAVNGAKAYSRRSASRSSSRP